MISFVIQNHAYRPLANFRRELVRCLAHNRPFLSGVGASGNPGAVQTGVAIFAETGALSQLWLFWFAPLVGAALGALIWRMLLSSGEAQD